ITTKTRSRSSCEVFPVENLNCALVRNASTRATSMRAQPAAPHMPRNQAAKITDGNASRSGKLRRGAMADVSATAPEAMQHPIRNRTNQGNLPIFSELGMRKLIHCSMFMTHSRRSTVNWPDHAFFIEIRLERGVHMHLCVATPRGIQCV